MVGRVCAGLAGVCTVSDAVQDLLERKSDEQQ